MLLGFAVLQDQENAHAGIHDGSIGLGVKFEAVLVTKSGATLRLMRHEVAESADDEKGEMSLNLARSDGPAASSKNLLHRILESLLKVRR
jgi:hypothetical protein